jgi:hypothetical protein
LPELFALMVRPLALVPPSRYELREILSRGAEAAGLRFQEGLPQRLLEDLRPGPGDTVLLPLAALTLQELWVHVAERGSSEFTDDDYAATGTVDGILTRQAERAYVTLGSLLGARAQALASQVFLALVATLRTHDPSLPLGELLDRTDGSDRTLALQVLEHLVRARVLRASYTGGSFEDERLSLVSGALPDTWPRLQTWVREDREGKRPLVLFQLDAQRWARGRPGGASVPIGTPPAARRCYPPARSPGNTLTGSTTTGPP